MFTSLTIGNYQFMLDYWDIGKRWLGFFIDLMKEGASVASQLMDQTNEELPEETRGLDFMRKMFVGLRTFGESMADSPQRYMREICDNKNKYKSI